VSAFLSGAACVWVFVYMYPRSRARVMLVVAHGN